MFYCDYHLQSLIFFLQNIINIILVVNAQDQLIKMSAKLCFASSAVVGKCISV